jgi:O-antigen/teichoic acid export membrane protein
MFVRLYTLRVILQTLGAEDYGIYNVVAGMVTMLAFLSDSMATATQRYYSFELGRGNSKQIKNVFSICIIIYILLAVIILLFTETVGLWFVNNKLILPLERKYAALWVYHFSVASFIFSILTSPYMAMIIAYEDMNIYAYMSVIDVLLKLVSVFLLQFIFIDKLFLYGLLMLSTTVIIKIVYIIICRIKYKECKFTFYWNKKLFLEITSYSGWNLFGTTASILKNQVMNIMLNQFFNPIVVAARSIASSVNGAATSFSKNFSTAIRPPIIKSYSSGNKSQMLSLLFSGTKGTYLLIYLFVLPLVLEMPMILDLWLKNPPDYAILFTRLTLIEVLFISLTYPTMTAVQATGKIKLYQAVTGGISLLNIPISWTIILLGAPPYSIMYVAIVLTIIAIIARLIILKHLINYSIVQFLTTVLLPILIVSVVSAVIPAALCYILKQGILKLFLVTGLSILSVVIFSYFIALDNKERQLVRELLSRYLFFKKKYT